MGPRAFVPSSLSSAILLFAAALLASVASPRAQEQPPGIGAGESYEQQSAFVGKAIAAIVGRIEEVAQLRARAQKEGSAVKVSCIDDKLRKIRAAHGAAQVIQGGWHLARNSAPFALRNLDRLRVLGILATANTDAAYACSDANMAAARMTRVDVTVDVPKGSGGGDIVRPPVIERPPLASPF